MGEGKEVVRKAHTHNDRLVAQRIGDQREGARTILGKWMGGGKQLSQQKGTLSKRQTYKKG